MCPAPLGVVLGLSQRGVSGCSAEGTSACLRIGGKESGPVRGPKKVGQIMAKTGRGEIGDSTLSSTQGAAPPETGATSRLCLDLKLSLLSWRPSPRGSL